MLIPSTGAWTSPHGQVRSLSLGRGSTSAVATYEHARGGRRWLDEGQAATVGEPPLVGRRARPRREPARPGRRAGLRPPGRRGSGRPDPGLRRRARRQPHRRAGDRGRSWSGGRRCAAARRRRPGRRASRRGWSSTPSPWWASCHRLPSGPGRTPRPGPGGAGGGRAGHGGVGGVLGAQHLRDRRRCRGPPALRAARSHLGRELPAGAVPFDPPVARPAPGPQQLRDRGAGARSRPTPRPARYVSVVMAANVPDLYLPAAGDGAGPEPVAT